MTIHPDVLSGNQVSGYEGLSWLEDKYGIPVYETHSYGLKDEETTKFFAENTFELGISICLLYTSYSAAAAAEMRGNPWDIRI